MKTTTFALLVASLFSWSCATIIAGGPDMVPVNSSPSGARILLDGVAVGVTPATVAFARSCEGMLRLEKDGYLPTQRDIDKVVNGWVFGNIILGGLIGLGIDLVTSNQGKYSTAPIYLEMVPTDSK